MTPATKTRPEYRATGTRRSVCRWVALLVAALLLASLQTAVSNGGPASAADLPPAPIGTEAFPQQIDGNWYRTAAVSDHDELQEWGEEGYRAVAPLPPKTWDIVGFAGSIWVQAGNSATDGESDAGQLYRLNGSAFQLVPSAPTALGSVGLTVFDGALWMEAPDGDERVWWRTTDGAAFAALAGSPEDVSDPVAFSGALFFKGSTGEGASATRSWFRSDHGVLSRVEALSTDLSDAVEMAGKLYLTEADRYGTFDLFVFDGATVTPVINGPRLGTTLIPYSGRIYFGADSIWSSRRLWSYDGTRFRLLSASVHDFASLVPFGDHLYWGAPDTDGVYGLHEYQPPVMITEPSLTDAYTRVGQRVTAQDNDRVPGAVLAYRWSIDGVPVLGATGASFVPRPDDLGKTLTVQITGSRAGYRTSSVTSTEVTVHSGRLPWTVVVPRSSFAVGQIARAEVLGSSARAKPYEIRYQWSIDGRTIDGATSTSYVPTAADQGKSLELRATVTKPGYQDDTGSISEPVMPAPAGAVIAANPVITGPLRVGQQLIVNPGRWGPASVQLWYQWLRNGEPIRNAMANSYTLTPVDGGAAISVVVSGHSGNVDPATRTSNAVQVPRWLLAPGVLIGGSRKVGFRMRAVSGYWVPGDVHLAYRWNRNGVPIMGAVRSTYVSTRRDAGSKITVTVTGTKNGWRGDSRTSAAKLIVR